MEQVIDFPSVRKRFRELVKQGEADPKGETWIRVEYDPDTNTYRVGERVSSYEEMLDEY